MTGPAGERPVHRFAHEAMKTCFEVLIAGKSRDYARQAAMAIFQEIDRIEGLLSRFDPASEIARINRLRPGEAIAIGPDAFEVLQRARQVFDETGGAFDVTVGALMQCWRDDEGRPLAPDAGMLAAAGRRVGMQRLVLQRDPAGGSASFVAGVHPDGAEPWGLVLDLGGIGKGFALDKAVELLLDWGIASALIHGGTSTALAWGDGPLADEGWRLGIGGPWGEAIGMTTLTLRNRALSGSGIEVKGEHLIDPATGQPARRAMAGWVACESATLSDALSTAFMLMPGDAVARYCQTHAGVGALLIDETPEGPVARRYGTLDAAGFDRGSAV